MSNVFMNSRVALRGDLAFYLGKEGVMFKKTIIVSVIIVLLAVPLADAEIIFFNNSNDFFQSTDIIHTEFFENSAEGVFPTEFDSFIYDGEGTIGHTTWRIDNAPGFNIPLNSFVLYSPAVGIDFLKLKSPFSAIGFDFAAPYNFETIALYQNIFT